MSAFDQFEGGGRPPSLRVLYVEDNVTDADLARRALTRLAPEIALEIASTVGVALEKLKPQVPLYDVILSDLRLSERSGLDLLTHIRERNLPLAFILLTGSGDQVSALAALKAGADDYLVKHGDYTSRLPQALRAALSRFRSAPTRCEKPLRVLYAEHNPFDIDLTLRYLLRHAPHIRLEVVGSGAEVLAALPNNASEASFFDVILLDIQLPGVDALEIAEILQEERGLDLPVVLITGQGNEEVVAQALRLGVSDYLVKHAKYLAELPVTLEQAYRRAQLQREQTALRESELRYRSLTANLPGVVYRCALDRDWTVSVMSDKMESLSGFPASDFIGNAVRTYASIIHPDDMAAVERSVQERGGTRDPFEIEYRLCRADGSVIWVQERGQGFFGPDGKLLWVDGFIWDITEKRRSKEQLQYLAHYDPLTGLPNRLFLEVRLEQALANAHRQGHRVGVLSIDLDQFKTINDSLGHATGDELLVAIAKRFIDTLRTGDTLSRVVGNQFVLVLETLQNFGELEKMARDLQGALEAPFMLPDGYVAYVRASIGISVHPQDGTTAQALLLGAAAAVHRAKEQGGNQFCFYTSELNVQARATLELEAALRRALEQREFVLHYQPKVDLRTGHIVGAEALLRWHRPGHGIVPPLQFIPQAEKSDLIVPIGAWVIETVCRQMSLWGQDGLGNVKVALNVSARQFRGGDLEEIIASALERYGVKPQHLMLELTESMLMTDPDDAVSRLTGLKHTGVRLSLDDFGTGYSSLTYLSRFPIDQLKIDQSFVRDIVIDPNAATIATSVIALAHRMQLKVVAEGVETEAQLGYLRQNGCDEMQGYYFSKPLPPAEFAALLRQGKTLPIPAAHSDARTLLIVDDEAHVLSALKRALQEEGYRILTALSASEALELLARNAVQVVLSDQCMAEMSGTEFLGRVKAIYPDTVRMVLSGHADLHTVMEAVNEGDLYRFLAKPWEDERLCEHIRDAFLYHEAILAPRKVTVSAL